MSSLLDLVNLLFTNPPKPNNRPDACRDCRDMPGLDINCGGDIEACRYCLGTSSANRMTPTSDWHSFDHSF